MSSSPSNENSSPADLFGTTPRKKRTIVSSPSRSSPSGSVGSLESSPARSPHPPQPHARPPLVPRSLLNTPARYDESQLDADERALDEALGMLSDDDDQPMPERQEDGAPRPAAAATDDEQQPPFSQPDAGMPRVKIVRARYDVKLLDLLASVNPEYRRLVEESTKHGAVYARDERHAHGAETPEYGRFWAVGLGLQSMPSNTRRWLTHGDQSDIDMVNSGPTLFWQTFNKLGYDGATAAVRAFCAERTHWLEQVQFAARCDYEAAKKLFIALTYGGSIGAWANEYRVRWRDDEDCIHGGAVCETRDFLECYQLQIRAAARWLVEAHGDSMAKIDLKQDVPNKAGRWLGLLLQDCERRCICAAMDAAEALGATVCGYTFDGMHIVGAPSDELLECIEAHVLHTVGYEIKLKVKSLQPTGTLGELIELHAAEVAPPNPAEGYDGKGNWDVVFAKYLARRFRDQIMLIGDAMHIYSPHSGLWAERKMIELAMVEDFAGTPYAQDMRYIERLNKAVRMLPELRREDIVWNKLPEGFIPLDNCLLNVYTGEVLSFEPGHMLRSKIPLHWRGDMRGHPDFAAAWARLAEDNRKVYGGDKALEEAVEFLLAFFSLVRGNPRKIALFLMGDGSNGKTALINRLKGVMGTNWVVSMDMSFFKKNNRQGTNSGGSNPQLVRAMKAHVVILEEGDATVEYCAAIFKEFTGGAPMSARLNYSNEMVCESNCAPVVNSNHPLQFTPESQAVTMRTVTVDLPSTFFNSTAELEAFADLHYPEPEDGDPAADARLAERAEALQRTLHLADHMFKERYQRDDQLRMVYFCSMLERLRRSGPPDEFGKYPAAPAVPARYLMTAAAAEDTPEKSITELYLEHFEETGDPSDFVATAEIAATIVSVAAKVTAREVAIAMNKRAEKAGAKIKKHQPNRHQADRRRGFQGVRRIAMGVFTV
jgi:hypothetical protein